MAAEADPYRAVFLHLVRMIQDSPDVRYYVSGSHTTMRGLLVAAIRASGFAGDPLEALEPAPHRANEEPRVLRLENDVTRLENGLDRIREALACGNDERAQDLVARLQRGEEV